MLSLEDLSKIFYCAKFYNFQKRLDIKPTRPLYHKWN